MFHESESSSPTAKYLEIKSIVWFELFPAEISRSVMLWDVKLKVMFLISPSIAFMIISCSDVFPCVIASGDGVNDISGLP